MASVFQKLNSILSKIEGSSTSQLEHVGSVRRSSTAGPSDEARPNPHTQVSDLAPQGPDAAPEPSKAMSPPPAPGPSHAFADESGEFREGEDRWEPLRAGRSGDSFPEELRSRLDSVHTKITAHRETIDFVLARGMNPSSHYYDDLDALHAEYDHLCRVLVETREASASRRCGDSPAAPSPPCPDEASPAAAPPPPRPGPLSRPAPRHSPQPGPSSSRDQRFASQDRSRPRDTPSDRSRDRGVSEDRPRKRFASGNSTGHRRRFASGDSPSPKRQRFTSGDSPSPKRQRFASRDSPSPKRRRFASGDSLLLSVGIRPVPPLMMITLRDPHRGFLLPIPLLLLGKIGTLMIPPSLPPFGRWWITFSRPFPSLRPLLPINRRDPLICLPLRAWPMWRFPQVRFCLGPKLFLILSRTRRSDSPVVLRMGRLATPFCLLSTSSRGYRILPLRGKN